ncbi:MAG TPA: protein kinase [Candidatus Competibacteraceae bacterium]|nr:protein kinase [Candidatus Competibacteraceae bacterium]HRZ07264.1 protein kinase [Candidatus Competibacteraceae bacterium]HSA45779.1 protein kinase [Candidatus Competibacteraceae bacterium]
MEIPGYTIVRKLGEGDFATVYLATQGRLNRQVALKVLNPALAANDDFTQRFLHEGRVIDLLRHPQIIPLFEFNFHEHYYYFSMEFLPGGTLAQHIQRGLIPDRALVITRLIAEALAYAHQRGVIHRDLKPQNILFRQDNTPVLTDFGIAKVMDGNSTLTMRNAVIGSLRYLSPEQAAGKTLDARSDLYSLGAIFYEMLTYQHPYPASDFIDLLMMQDAIPELPKELEKFQPILNKMLAKKPDDRFDSAEQLVQALGQLETGPSARSSDSQKPTIPFPIVNPKILEPLPSIAEIPKPPPSIAEIPKPPRSKTVWIMGSSFLFVMAVTTGVYLTFFRPTAPELALPPAPQSLRPDPDAAQRQTQDLARQQMIEERLRRSVEEEVKRQAIEAERLHQIEEEAKRQAVEAERLRKIEEEAQQQAAENERLRKIEEEAKRRAAEAERLRKIEEEAKRQTAKPSPPEPEKPPVIESAPRKTPTVAKPAEPARPSITPEIKRKPAVAETSQSRRCGNLLSRITLGEPVSNEDRMFITKECR